MRIILNMTGLKAVSLIVALSAFSGCESSSSPHVGNYQGTLIMLNGGSSLQKYAVAAKLSRSKDDSMHLEIQGNPEIKSSLDITLTKDGKNIDLNIPGTSIQNQKLVSDHGCFTSQSPLNIRLCGQPNSIVIDAQSETHQALYSLSIEYFGDVAGGISLETPRAFTLDDAVTQAMVKDFNTRIEFEHMLQARLSAKSAYQNMIPHLSGSSIIGLASGPLSVIGAIAMAGDLAPFLFPSRWIQAKEGNQLRDAESDALALVKGDAGINVEILAYGIDHDLQMLAFLNQDYTDALTIRVKVAALEATNLVPTGTTEHVESILASIHDAMDDLSYPLQDEYAALSQAMGFVNPLAVSAIQVPQTPPTPLNGQLVLKLEDFETLVLDRSIELRQMNHVIDAAHSAVKADYFSWFDPSSDEALGFGLGSAIAVDRSQVNALEIRKNQVASTLLQNLETAIVQYNHSMDDVADSASGMKLEKDRKDKLMAELDSGQPVSATEITSVPLDQITWQLNSLDAMMDYRSSMAIIQRMLLQGHYSNLDGTHITR